VAVPGLLPRVAVPRAEGQALCGYQRLLATATAAYALIAVFGFLGSVTLGRFYLFGKLGWFVLLGGVLVFFKEFFK
jgi:hypothetical protein